MEELGDMIAKAIQFMIIGREAPPNAPRYATGGLADFTGPAWLDGTKSNPEYVLSAQQTRSFMQLVDILDMFRHGFNVSRGENFGDNIVDIDINIETVKEEADVDMLADKV
jgi:hypothetical protein